MAQAEQPVPVSTVLGEVSADLKAVIHSELKLAFAEVREAIEQLKIHLTQLVLFGVVAALGIFPLLASAAIGLGKILNENYWLSSLVVAAVCIGIGGAMAYRALGSLKKARLNLAHTRTSLEREVALLGRKVTELKDATRRRNV